MKYFAKVDGDPVVISITITSDESDTRGFFVYYQAGADTFDTWHPTLAEAFSMATVMESTMLHGIYSGIKKAQKFLST